MILVDYSQVAISNIMAQIGHFAPKDLYVESNVPVIDNLEDAKPILNEGMVRHMVLNSLRSYRAKFGRKYGDLVICVDSKNYWRREVFPYYKHGRKKNRENSVIDWPMVFETLNKLRVELSEFMPYRVVNIDRAEADDVIAIVAKQEHLAENVLVLSGDKDFGQLQKYKNIDQYAPIQKTFINVDSPVEFLREHIMKGDDGDGIPNFLSPDDVFATGGRQKPLKKTDLARWIKIANPLQFCTPAMWKGYERNQELIDLNNIPKSVVDPIIEEWDKPFTPNRKLIYDYFVQFDLVEMLKHIGEF